MYDLRFKLSLSAVYFNPTERCNLNCDYCYIPESLRKNGKNMSKTDIFKAMNILKEYFTKTLPENRKPQIIFHGAEPMLNKEYLFETIDAFKNDFAFGVQTNGTLFDDKDLEFLTSRDISIGLSLDGHIDNIANITRKNWAGKGVFEKVVETIKKLKGYHNYSVICTVTTQNMNCLTDIIEFFHGLEVPYCMLNPVRCTMSGARKIKPRDDQMAQYYLSALDRTYQLYQETGRKIVVANFANVLMSILAPTGRRLMCDISPCGGGRCFLAISADGNTFPCSEFIGLDEFCGGNIFKDNIKDIINTSPFMTVKQRKVENINPCFRCAIKHFCGAPCPAEAYSMNGDINTVGAFCELYEQQVRYAFRLIADGKEDAYLWDNWNSDMTNSFEITI